LDNGLRVVLFEDHVAPLVAVNVSYGVGSRHERTGRTGLAHLFEHLMFQGSAHVAEGEHAALMTGAGGRFNAATSFEWTACYETLPTGHLELALWLEADRMATMAGSLTQAKLDNQRDVVKNERRQRYDTMPYGTAAESLHAMGFPPGHPYAHLPIGSMADLDAATLDDCRDFFATHYAPGNAVLAIAGDIDPEQAGDAVRRYFGHLRPRTAADPPHDVAGPIERTVREQVRERVPAAAYFVLFRLPRDGTQEIEAADLAVDILAAGRSSRLHDRLVRGRLATDVHFAVDRYAWGASVGMLSVLAVDGVDLADIETAVAEELRLLAADGPTAAELERVHAQAERRFLDRTGSVTGIADRLARNATLFGDPARTFTTVERVAAVTAEQVTATVAARLSTAGHAVLTYEPIS
jgi:predicted Zn-dependent peptidase